jgi:integrase/recombinase XerD
MPRLSPPKADTLSLSDAYTAFDRSLRVAGKSPRTVESYAYAAGKLVDAVGGDCSLTGINAEHIESTLLTLRDERGMSPASVHNIYRSLSAFFTWAVKRGHIAASPTKGIVAPKVVVQPVRFVTDDEWRAILRTTVERSRHAFRARRDRAILYLFATTGARLSEVATLTVADVDLTLDVVTLHGKGGRDRDVALDGEAKTALLAYLRSERVRSPYSSSPSLWLGPKGVMTASGIAQMLAERAKAAGIAWRVHPHSLRHRFVSKALADGQPAPIVMAMTGHTTPAMLVRYGAFNRQQDAIAAQRKMIASGVL